MSWTLRIVAERPRLRLVTNSVIQAQNSRAVLREEIAKVQDDIEHPSTTEAERRQLRAVLATLKAHQQEYT